MDIAWFDQNGGNGQVLQVMKYKRSLIPTALFDSLGCMQALNEDSQAVQNAISERLGIFVRNVTTCIAGLIVGKYFKAVNNRKGSNEQHLFLAAFTKGWDMALVIVAMLPLLIAVGLAVSVVTSRLQVSI